MTGLTFRPVNIENWVDPEKLLMSQDLNSVIKQVLVEML
jgi:hypothetical protein